VRKALTVNVVDAVVVDASCTHSTIAKSLPITWALACKEKLMQACLLAAVIHRLVIISFSYFVLQLQLWKDGRSTRKPEIPYAGASWL